MPIFKLTIWKSPWSLLSNLYIICNDYLQSITKNTAVDLKIIWRILITACLFYIYSFLIESLYYNSTFLLLVQRKKDPYHIKPAISTFSNNPWRKNSIPTSQKYFCTLFPDKNLDKKITYLLPRKISTSKSFRAFQYKILKNILYLHKMPFCFWKISFSFMFLL